MNPDISCAACGRSYRRKAELVGKRVRCKCGATIEIPEESAAENSEFDPPTFDNLDIAPEAAAFTTSAAAPPPRRAPSRATAAGRPGSGSSAGTPLRHRMLAVAAMLLFGSMFAGLGVWQMGAPGAPLDTGRARRAPNALLTALYNVGGNKLIAWLCFAIAGFFALFSVYLIVLFLWDAWRERD